MDCPVLCRFSFPSNMLILIQSSHFCSIYSHSNFRNNPNDSILTIFPVSVLGCANDMTEMSDEK